MLKPEEVTSREGDEVTDNLIFTRPCHHGVGEDCSNDNVAESCNVAAVSSSNGMWGPDSGVQILRFTLRSTALLPSVTSLAGVEDFRAIMTAIRFHIE